MYSLASGHQYRLTRVLNAGSLQSPGQYRPWICSLNSWQTLSGLCKARTLKKFTLFSRSASMPITSLSFRPLAALSINIYGMPSLFFFSRSTKGNLRGSPNCLRRFCPSIQVLESSPVGSANYSSLVISAFRGIFFLVCTYSSSMLKPKTP